MKRQKQLMKKSTAKDVRKDVKKTRTKKTWTKDVKKDTKKRRPLEGIEGGVSSESLSRSWRRRGVSTLGPRRKTTMALQSQGRRKEDPRPKTKRPEIFRRNDCGLKASTRRSKHESSTKKKPQESQMCTHDRVDHRGTNRDKKVFHCRACGPKKLEPEIRASEEEVQDGDVSKTD
jgi:hypothetical protein